MAHLESAFTKVAAGNDDQLTPDEIKVLDAHLRETHDTIKSTADLLTELEELDASFQGAIPSGYVDQYIEEAPDASKRVLKDLNERYTTDT